VKLRTLVILMRVYLRLHNQPTEWDSYFGEYSRSTLPTILDVGCSLYLESFYHLHIYICSFVRYLSMYCKYWYPIWCLAVGITVGMYNCSFFLRYKDHSIAVFSNHRLHVQKHPTAAAAVPPLPLPPLLCTVSGPPPVLRPTPGLAGSSNPPLLGHPTNPSAPVNFRNVRSCFSAVPRPRR